MKLLDKETFKSDVLEATAGYQIVDFFSDGCVPCQALMPDVVELAAEYEGRVEFTKLNTTKARRLAISQKVLGLPTIILYKDGEKIAEVTKDDATREGIKKMIDNNIG